MEEDDVARGRHGFGTYDRSTKTWKLRTKTMVIKASIKKLNELFPGNAIPADERKSYPFWKKFLETAKAVNVLTTREQKLADAKIKFAEGDTSPTAPWPVGLCTEFEKCEVTGEVRYKKRLSDDEFRIVSLVNGIQDQNNPADFRDYLREQLAATMAPKAIPATESLAHEITVTIDREKAKGHRGYLATKKYLNMFLAACGGDIKVADIGVHQFRAYFKVVNETATWGKRTKFNAVKTAKIFLKRVEANFALNFAFLRSPEFKASEPDGKKVQWTLEQVKTGLKEATGLARTLLLFGLNTGGYLGDLVNLKPEHVINGERIEKQRAKMRHDDDAFIGSWKLWPETKSLIQFGLKGKNLELAFKAFKDAHGLPIHKALRKTVTQWLEVHVGEKVARMYRCEKIGDTHNKSYVKFSDEHKAMLDDGLAQFAKAMGIAL